MIPWVLAAHLYFVNASPGQVGGVFFNSYTNVGAQYNKWTTVDLTGIIPAECRTVHLTGIMIITHGTNTEDANLQLSFRKNGDNTDYSVNYAHQAIAPFVGDGVREGVATWVPLDDSQKFQYLWRTPLSTLPGGYPAWSSYGTNLRVDACAAP